MSRSEERVQGAPGMKPMHLMVNRRQAPDKKTSLVNESLYDGLVTFAEDRQDSDFGKPQKIQKHPPRRSTNISESDRLSSPRNFGDEAVRRKDFEISFQKEAANSTLEADRNDGALTKMINRRHRRAASLDMKQLKNIRLGPTLTTSLSFKENRLGDVVPEKLMANDSTGKFAYISLDGRLINAELATSATSIGGGLGEEESQAWEDFAPMQRVLIVAVSAAAAAAAKHRNRKEIDMLLKTVDNREKELLLLRQQLGELCKQSHTNASHIHPEPLQSHENPTARSSPTTPAQREFATTPEDRSFDGGSTKVKLDLHESWSSSKLAPACARPDGDARRLSRGSPVKEDAVLVESANVTPCKGDSSFFSSTSFPVDDEAWANEEAKWYVNPMVETSQDFYNISTPERLNSMFSVCNPAAEGSFEWTVLRSSFANRDADLARLSLVESPPRSSQTEATVSNWSYQPKSQLDGILHKEHNAMRAVCAAVVLDLRERMLKILDKEASMVMAALDRSVEDAKAQIACMHLGVAGCWNASVPKALAALSLSPSDFDSYLNETQGPSTWSDISKIEESIVAWRRYLETSYGAKVPSETNSPNKCRSVEAMVSKCGADERSTTSSCPRSSGQDGDAKLGSRCGGPACPTSFASELTEQLIKELDKAAAKVAAMERHMKKLELDVAGCDGEPVRKLADCTKQELENQAKGREDVAELVRQLQSKEVEVADLKKGQQILKRKSKTRKIEEENTLCPVASRKGYGTIYWERAAGQKKTKFQTEPGESKAGSNLLMTNNETETLVDIKKKEIEELKDDHQRRNAELDRQLAAAETTKAATANRLAVLEELCKQKDSTLSYLKQDLQSLESKVHGSRVNKSPATPRAQQNSMSSNPSSSSGYGTLQKQRFSDKYAPSPPSGYRIREHVGRLRRDTPSSKGQYRMSIQKHEEIDDDGRSEHGYDQETSLEYSSPPGSTIGDDCSVNSLAFSETEVESRLESEYCSSGDDLRYLSSKDRLAETKASSCNRTLRKQKSASSDLRRAITSTASSSSGLSRGPAKIPSSATSLSKTVSREKQPAKSLTRTLSDGLIRKPMKDPNSPWTSNLKGQEFVARNTVVNHRRSSSLDMNFKSSSILETCASSGKSQDGGSFLSYETSATKRKRWV